MKSFFYILISFLDTWSVEARKAIDAEVEAWHKMKSQPNEVPKNPFYAENDIVLLRCGNNYRRGCIIEINSRRKSFYVFIVDYGIRISCSISAIRAAPPHLARIPFMVCDCCLKLTDFLL